jgi:predicted CoA-binding protein
VPFDYPDALIERVLSDSKTIALVGASPRPERASFRVMRFLQSRGHKIYPVNPVEAGCVINGETVLTSLDEAPVPVDMVDIFRRSSQAGEAVDDAIRIGAKSVWMQLDVIDEDAAHRAEKAGLTVIMDRCPVIECRRLGI